MKRVRLWGRICDAALIKRNNHFFSDTPNHSFVLHNRAHLKKLDADLLLAGVLSKRSYRVSVMSVAGGQLFEDS